MCGDEADADWQAGLIEAGIEDTEQWLGNRERKTLAKRRRFWCPKCDRNLISVGQKCKVCGFKNMEAGK